MRTSHLIGMTLCAAAFIKVGILRGADLPRYKLQVGEVLTYETSSTGQTNGKPEPEKKGTARIIVTGVDGAGWNFVVIAKEGAASATAPADDTDEETAATRISGGTVYPEGRVSGLGLSDREGMGRIFFTLPETEKDFAGYSAVGPNGSTAEVKVTEQTPKGITLAAHLSAPLFDVYHIHQDVTVIMDPLQGVTTTVQWRYGMNDEGRNTSDVNSATLQRVEMKEAAWAQQMGKDMATLTAAEKAYDALSDGLSGSEAEMKTTLQKGREAFLAAGAAVITPVIKKRFTTLAANYENYDSYAIKDALRLAAVKDKAAPDWTLDKVGGGKMGLQELHGKVVLLDFWYKDCPWCIRAMPAINQVAADYKDKGAVVVGMNVDEKEADAQSVIDLLGLKYASVKAKRDFAMQYYGVTGYPTLVVIDQQGIVRKIDVGYSPTLRQDLGEVVDGLLKKNDK